MPHRIRLRDWAALEPPSGTACVLQRYFNRPTNLDDCVVCLCVDARGSSCQAELNGHVLTPDSNNDQQDCIRWSIEVEAIQPRNEFRLTWPQQPPASIEACLEIHDG